MTREITQTRMSDLIGNAKTHTRKPGIEPSDY